jgi:hypothetical protein
MTIKSMYFFLNNCYNDLIKLISDIIPKLHKVPKDMYQSKKLLSGVGMKDEKIDVCPDNYLLFSKEHAKDKKCSKCGKSWFIKVMNKDSDNVMTEVTHK